MKEIRKISIIGMGALGLLYGSMISEGIGAESVSYVMDRARCEKYKGQTFTVNEKVFPCRIVCDEEAEEADLLIVAVKACGLEAAIGSMRKVIGKDTVVISVMNGITSEEEIGKRYGFEGIVYCVAQGMDAMKFGNALSYMHKGELRIGAAKTTDGAAYERLVGFLTKAGVPFTEDTDILHRLWGKFMLNVGINQTCMVYGCDYGTALAPGRENRTLIAAMREVIAVANAAGIALSEADLNQYIVILHGLSPEGVPSMAQDRINRKPSEVESFAGTVLRLAEKYGLFAPENAFLYREVQRIEKEYL